MALRILSSWEALTPRLQRTQLWCTKKGASGSSRRGEGRTAGGERRFHGHGEATKAQVPRETLLLLPLSPGLEAQARSEGAEPVPAAQIPPRREE